MKTGSIVRHVVPSTVLDCWIQEPQPFNAKYYSHKQNHAGLRYEIVIGLGSSKIVWFSGGHPCGEFSDLALARSGFTDILEDGEQALADKGYRDGRQYFLTPYTTPNTGWELNFNVQHKKVMARSESVNKRIQQFNILGNFRHSEEKHYTCFAAIINTTQLDPVENPLWSGKSSLEHYLELKYTKKNKQIKVFFDEKRKFISFIA